MSLSLNIFSTTEERVFAIEIELSLALGKIKRLQDSEMRLEDEVIQLKQIININENRDGEKKLITPSNHILSYKQEKD